LLPLPPATEPLAMAAIDKVSQTIMAGDSGGTTRYSFSQVPFPGSSPTRWMSDRHFNGTTFAFADGHVKWLKLSRSANGYPIAPTVKQGVYWYADGHA